jgi:hypothetical protein
VPHPLRWKPTCRQDARRDADTFRKTEPWMSRNVSNKEGGLPHFLGPLRPCRASPNEELPPVCNSRLPTDPFVCTEQKASAGRSRWRCMKRRHACLRATCLR